MSVFCRSFNHGLRFSLVFANVGVFLVGRRKGAVSYRTILPWMAHETQYCSFRYILGTEYSAKTEASEMSP